MLQVTKLIKKLDIVGLTIAVSVRSGDDDVLLPPGNPVAFMTGAMVALSKAVIACRVRSDLTRCENVLNPRWIV